MAERENVARSKTSRGEGLVPRWGRSGAWQNPPCQLAIPNHNSGFSHLGAPATAGMGDCYENSYPLPPNSSFSRKRESRGEVWVVAMTLELSHQPMRPIFIPWCAGTSRHQRLVRKCALQSTSMPALPGRNVPNCRPTIDGGTRKCSAGACPPLGSEWGVAESTVPTRHTKSQLRFFTPWCAGNSRHERLL